MTEKSFNVREYFGNVLLDKSPNTPERVEEFSKCFEVFYLKGSNIKYIAQELTFFDAYNIAQKYSENWMTIDALDDLLEIGSRYAAVINPTRGRKMTTGEYQNVLRLESEYKIAEIQHQLEFIKLKNSNYSFALEASLMWLKRLRALTVDYDFGWNVEMNQNIRVQVNFIKEMEIL